MSPELPERSVRPDGVLRRPSGLRTALTATVAMVASAAALGAGASPALAADACPNAALRVANFSTLLPDCRAYEQVSEVDKGGNENGAGPQGAMTSYVRMSANGNQVVYGSADAFAGADAGIFNGYMATRGPSGWRTIPLTPPDYTSDGTGAQVLAVSEDFQRQVISEPNGVAALDGHSGLFLREPDGNFTWITPGHDPAIKVSQQGQSADLSHVLFATSEALLPEAAGVTSGASLYDWTGGRLRLVGIKPDGSVDPKGAVLGAQEQNLSNSAPVLNAVSPDGSRIVFQSPDPTVDTTSDPSRVYVRIDGTRTVEASRSRCTRLDCNAPTAAKYEGASADSTRVLFVTAQQLVNEDTDANADIYRYDVETDTLTRLTVGAGTVEGVLAASDDTERVYYQVGASGPLAPPSIQLADHGVQRLVASGSGIYNPPESRRASQTDRAGSTLVFSSGGFSVTPPGGAPGPSGRYRYDVATGGLQRIASSTSGGLTNGGDSFTTMSMYNHAVSDDGSTILFATADALVPQDQNGDVVDIYQWRDGVYSLITTGTDSQGSLPIGLSANADVMMFMSRAPLTPSDRDGAFDIYQARVGGGFPVTVPAVPCAGDACQGELGVRPGLSSAGSLAFSGLGNVSPAASGPAASEGSVSVKRPKTVRGKTKVRLSVKAPEAGRIRVSGSGLRRAKRTAKRSTRYHVTVKLSRRSKRILKRKHRVKVRATVRFTPKRGRRSQVRVHVTFKPKKTHHKRSKGRTTTSARPANGKGGR